MNRGGGSGNPPISFSSTYSISPAHVCQKWHFRRYKKRPERIAKNTAERATHPGRPHIPQHTNRDCTFASALLGKGRLAEIGRSVLLQAVTAPFESPGFLQVGEELFLLKPITGTQAGHESHGCPDSRPPPFAAGLQMVIIFMLPG